MKRVAILAGALVVTLGSLWLAMSLGSLAFEVRRTTQHDRRLRKVMAEPQVTAERLTKAFVDEGTLLLAAPGSPEERERVIAGPGGKRAAELRDKVARYPDMRVFATDDMLYFVFFDGDGLMRDFALVSR
jgi:hypothetical protein